MSAGWGSRVQARLDRADELLGGHGHDVPPIGDVAAAATATLAALAELAAQALELAIEDATR